MGKMKKGFFISLTAVIILVIIITFLEISKTNKARESDLGAQYLKSKLSVDYAADAVNVYLPSLLAYTGKYAMGNASNLVDSAGALPDLPDAITKLMNTGTFTAGAYTATMHPDHTLTTAFPRTLTSVNTGVTIHKLDATVLEVSQLDEWTILMKTEVNLSLRSGDITFISNKNYSSFIDMNGLFDPAEGMPIQIEFYKSDASEPCYLGVIYSTYFCNGVAGIVPMD